MQSSSQKQYKAINYINTYNIQSEIAHNVYGTEHIHVDIVIAAFNASTAPA